MKILQLINPDAIIPIRLNADPVHERVIHSVWGFFALYIVQFCGSCTDITSDRSRYANSFFDGYRLFEQSWACIGSCL